MSYCTITCGHCGHTGDFDAFTSTPVSGDLPPGAFQCPRCRQAWARRQKGELRWIAGQWVAEAVEVVPVQGRL